MAPMDSFKEDVDKMSYRLDGDCFVMVADAPGRQRNRGT